ncbi:MAG: NERD domain-containing protein [Anaerolineae bacterium]|nr:NERD domain-containing protein [Anaerolineae bacterium]MBT7325193.1 NERD domain-containing protein [Anaerolineae bacterium]
MQQLLSSPDLAGALAELQLAEFLSHLPENYFVIHDVQLSFDRAIRFDDAWRKTAQIDTVVISPAGIFVIEVKNWSKEFSESNNYHDPYDQVKWAWYLCKIQTGIKTRSIIAHTGHIPTKPKGSYAKTLHLNEVNGYVLYFKDRIISDETMNKIAGKLDQSSYSL